MMTSAKENLVREGIRRIHTMACAVRNHASDEASVELAEGVLALWKDWARKQNIQVEFEEVEIPEPQKEGV